MSIPRPNFVFRIDVFHHDAPGEVLEAAIKTLGDEMAKSFAKLIEELHATGEEIKAHRTAADEAEAREDADAATRDEANAAKIAEAEAKIAELQARIDGGTLSESQEAEAAAAIAKVRADAGLTEPTEPSEPTEPAPTEPPAEPPPGEVPAEEV
jgi:hypothetical protein